MCFTKEKRKGRNNLAVLLMSVLLMAVCVQAAVVPSSKQTLELKPGWNLVTLTRPLESMPSNMQKFLSLHPFSLDTGSQSYVRCEKAEDVLAGKGYWVFSSTQQTIELAQDISQTATQPSLVKGWNLVGMLGDASWADSAASIWKWEDGHYKTIEKKDLKTGYAYWVFFND